MTNCLHGGEHEFEIHRHNCEINNSAFEVKTLCIYCGIRVRSLLFCKSDGEIGCKLLGIKVADQLEDCTGSQEAKVIDEPKDNECNTEPQFDENDRD